MRIARSLSAPRTWNQLKSLPIAFPANGYSERACDPNRSEVPGRSRILFEYACRLTCDGIRHQNPGIDEAQVQRILHERLALARRLERRAMIGNEAVLNVMSRSMTAAYRTCWSDRIRTPPVRATRDEIAPGRDSCFDPANLTPTKSSVPTLDRCPGLLAQRTVHKNKRKGIFLHSSAEPPARIQNGLCKPSRAMAERV